MNFIDITLNQLRARVTLTQVIEELVEERGLDKAVLSDIIRQGILSAFKKKYVDHDLAVTHDKKTDQIAVQIKKTVVASVEDDDIHITLRRARNINPDSNLGDELWLPFEGSIGRIDVLRAKQVIATRIREIESLAIFEEFKSKEGTVVVGIVHKCERSGSLIKLGDTLAFLPNSLSIPGQKYSVGFTIRALLKEVLPELRGESQLILDRASADFVKALFELEVPEIFENLVEIKKIVRTPGYKTKIIVVSHDKNVDAVGTCVGLGGGRIRPILKELGTEKIDIITNDDLLENLVKNALKPAVINKVTILSPSQVQVWLDEDQRSVAIGKMGQNIALASRLTGCEIHLMSKNLDVDNESNDYDTMQVNFDDYQQ